MATDATGTPTSLGIPTFNVDNDAPSGLGFNEAMTEIDTLIKQRVLGPTGVADGEVPVWDATTSTWVRSGDAVGKGINPSSLKGYPSDGTKYLDGSGAWSAPPATGAMTPIFDLTLATAQGTIDTNTILGGNIPQTYASLMFVFSAANDLGTAGLTPVLVTVNNDVTDANYRASRAAFAGATASGSQTNDRVSGGYLYTNNLGTSDLLFANYTKTSGGRHWAGRGSYYSSGQETYITSGSYIGASGAITRIMLSPSSGNFLAGSRLTLYGIAG